MGCCLSTKTSSKPPEFSKTSSKNLNISKSPPPTPPILEEEEETVKEVLSETRTVPRSPSPQAQRNRQPESPFIKSAPLLLSDFSRNPNAHEDHQNGVVLKKSLTPFNGGDDVSEDVVSEICSTQCESESVSVSTTVTEKRDEKNDELREQLRQSSPARRKNTTFSGEVKREKTVGRSPYRRSDPSPSRARPGLVSGSGYGNRTESRESSGRRSRSPVTRGDSGSSRMGPSKNTSARKMGKSPVPAGSVLAERIQNVKEEREDGGDNNWPPTNGESLENPLVSLECFIFL